MPREMLARALKCRSWGCEHCAPDRRNQLMAMAAGGLPERFLTLTINPDEGADPADRLAILANSWRLIVKRLRRLHPGKVIEFLAVVEETKAGEPHLHILLRSPYIPQGLLSGWMKELANSPIVDIRRIKNAREVVRYVAKYITKAPAQFGSRKRYWHSGHWEVDPYEKPETPEQSAYHWTIDRRPLWLIALDWTQRAWSVNHQREDWLTGHPLVWPAESDYGQEPPEPSPVPEAPTRVDNTRDGLRPALPLV